MTNTMTCPHCHRTVEVPPGFMQWAGRCECGRSVFDAVQDDDQGTTTNEKSPAPAATSNEGKSFEERSVTTAYLSHRGRNTGVSYGTWSGVSLPMDDYITIAVPLESVRRMHKDGAVPVDINPDCVAEQSREVRQRREQLEEKRRREARNRIRSRVSEEHDAELTALEEKIEALQQQIDAKVDAILAAKNKGAE